MTAAQLELDTRIVSAANGVPLTVVKKKEHMTRDFVELKTAGDVEQVGFDVTTPPYSRRPTKPGPYKDNLE